MLLVHIRRSSGGAARCARSRASAMRPVSSSLLKSSLSLPEPQNAGIATNRNKIEEKMCLFGSLRSLRARAKQSRRSFDEKRDCRALWARNDDDNFKTLKRHEKFFIVIP